MRGFELRLHGTEIDRGRRTLERWVEDGRRGREWVDHGGRYNSRRCVGNVVGLSERYPLDKLYQTPEELLSGLCPFLHRQKESVGQGFADNQKSLSVVAPALSYSQQAG